MDTGLRCLECYSDTNCIISYLHWIFHTLEYMVKKFQVWTV